MPGLPHLRECDPARLSRRVAAHLDLLQHQERTEPAVLDDKQFSEVIEHFIPPDLSPFNDALWRSYFIVGWICVFLGLASQEA
ncbi:MAG TPA: hypothetical protein VKV37_10310 [Ktedonobacteraceae bacterium]|nr:hypothetical protein [Ktedonobacteraceae bacterium]